MTVTEQLYSLGSWTVTLADDTPRAVTDQLGFFGHVAIWRGRVDVDLTDDATLLTSARYVGVLREKPNGPRSLQGSGMIYWLGDEDGKGAVLEDPVTFTNASLTTCVTTLLPPSVAVGSIHDPGGTYTGTHQWQTPRAVLDTITTAFGVEYRANGNGTVDVGTAAQLYGSTASTIISARSNGQDYDLTSLGSQFDTDTAVIDYTSRVVVLGQKTDAAGTSTQFVEGTADAASYPYKDLRGNPVKITRAVADAGQTDSSAPAAAQLQLNLYNRTKRALTIQASDYDMSSAAVVGQNAYVFDPENGLYDPATQVDFRGELIFPILIRISALQWSVTDGHTVAFRTQDGTWIDLTRWVVWDPGSDQITVGDLPRTLTSYANPVLTQTQSAPDASTPDAPTGLTLTTTSVESTAGQSTAIVTASWTAPTQNTDGSVLTDLSYYLVQYRWRNRAPQWTSLPSPTTTVEIPNLVVGLLYDVQVAAVDTTGHFSVPTPIQSITAAPDQTAPNPPSDPTVTSYLGQLRIAWDGKDNTGAAMPPDFAIVEVHVSATSGFTPDSSPGSATLVSELSTAGVAYATAPYAATRYVKLVAVDNSGNRSAPSGQASAATTQVVSADIFDGAVGTAKLADLAVTTAKINDLAVNDAKIGNLSVGKLTAGALAVDVTVSGRIATALTGARTEMNALGFVKYASDGVTKLIDFTGATNLLIGTLQTATTGRRLVSGASGNSGKIQFIAPDGTTSILESVALSGGGEGVSLHLPVSGANPDFWNAFRIDSGGLAFIDAKYTHLAFGGTPGSNDGDFRLSFATSKGDATTQPVLSDRMIVTETVTQLYDGTTLRQQIDSTGVFFKYWSDGNFTVSERSRSSGVEAAKMIIQFDSINFYRGQTQDFNIWDRVTGGAVVPRLQVQDDRYNFLWNGTGSKIVLFPSDNSGNGARVQMMHASGFGITTCFRGNTDGSSGRLQVTDAVNTTFMPVWASAFTVNSTRDAKTDITDAPTGALARVRSLRPRQYSRTGGWDADRKHQAPNGRPEVGLVVDEAYEEIQTVDETGTPAGINLYCLAVEQLAALQELAAQVDELNRGKP